MSQREPTVDYYALLGVARNATGDEIKKAYRREALLAHPDHAPAYDPDRFHSLKDAVDTLLDPARRRRHDVLLLLHPPLPPATVKHDLSFVTRFVKKRRPTGLGKALATLFGRNVCPDCDGAGRQREHEGERLCSRCGGSGRVRR